MIVVAASVALDLAARSVTQDAIATDVQKSTHSEGASASISSFPFLYDVAAEGRIDRVAITDRGVPAGPLRLDQVRLVASQVRFDRHELFTQHAVRLTDVGSATVTVQARLTSLTGTIARDLGIEVTSSASNRITVSAGGVTVARIDLTKVPIIPDCPLDVTHSGEVYTFSCTVSPVPPSVLEALSKAGKI